VKLSHGDKKVNEEELSGTGEERQTQGIPVLAGGKEGKQSCRGGKIDRIQGVIKTAFVSNFF